MLSAKSHPTSRKRFGTFTVRARLIVDPAVRIVDAVMVEKKTVVPVIVEPVRVETVMVEPVRVETVSPRVLIVLPVSVEYDTLPAFKVDAMTVELLRSTLR
jgi:hypothetical protein